MPQFFVDAKLRIGSEVEIQGGDARHISKVLRLQDGDWIVLSDGQGHSFKATITQSKPNRVKADIREEVKRRKGKPPPALAIALVKRDRFEWAIEKAVELGVKQIIPYTSGRTQSPKSQDLAKKMKRWREIALAAAIQSGLPFRPTVEPVLGFDELMDFGHNFDRTVFFYEGEDERDIKELFGGKKAKSRDLLVIGPEGGFTADEIEMARKAGAMTVSLGTQILRVETAAVAALAIWQYELGNMDV